MSGGFFSLSRLLGKKNKNEKTFFNRSSKTSVQSLSKSVTNLEEMSNKITPLATAHNAPFEQTFRITVYLPLQQLFVKRLGAKTKLYELLDVICINKQLNSKKFEFRHPTDDTQIFDLNLTIGEVGLSELKLMHRHDKDSNSVQYRTHSNGQENQFNIRPHTISVSQYSSTNSLNSCDISGIVVNQRSFCDQIPSAIGRKKRIAPRPPSQNSIPERNESLSRSTISRTNQVVLNNRDLVQQSYYVSSPNLSVCSNYINSISNTNSISGKDITANRPNQDTYIHTSKMSKKSSLNRPSSVQLQNSIYEDQRLNCESDIVVNSSFRRRYSMTSSEDLTTNDQDLSIPQKKRPIIGKTKAPAPQPRNILCQSRNLNIKDERIVKNVQNVERIGNYKESNENSMVEDTETEMPNVTFSINSQFHNSKVDKNHSFSNEKTRFNFDSNINQNQEELKIDPIYISEQINEIIDEAVKINEALLNAQNETKNEKSCRLEINNNDTNDNQYDSEEYICQSLTTNLTSHPSDSFNENISSERVDKIIFVENNENSMLISTSTGPDSIITSDIEDGYRGHELENKLAITERTFEDSKEEITEKIKEPLAVIDKPIDSIKTHKLFSSTMVVDDTTHSFDTSYGEKDVINELTDIIDCNRLETLIKSKNEVTNSFEVGKQSLLSNFHIGSYSSNNNQAAKEKDINTTKGSIKSDHTSEICSNLQSIIINEKSNTGEDLHVKSIGRSLSFHSTFGSVKHEKETATRNVKNISGTNACNKETLSDILSKKSSSELSIANIPSLKSINVMKSILNNSHLDNKSINRETCLEDNKKQSNDTKYGSINSLNSTLMNTPTQLKTWKYNGPPSVQLSTWGERPKDVVHIKSDDDYTSAKIPSTELLQNQCIESKQKTENKLNEIPALCKLPIVRGVEYKKNIALNKQHAIVAPATGENRSPHSNYSVSRIIPRIKSPVMETLNRNVNKNQISRNNFLENPELVNRVQNNGEQHENSTAQFDSKIKNSNITSSETENEIFIKFNLRKTGLKEKIFDESNFEKKSHHSKNMKINTDLIPTVPTPPPIQKQLPKQFPVENSRDELLNSIRNFNRETLKRKYTKAKD